MKDDEVEWFEDLEGENEQELANELESLIEQAGEFYDSEMDGLE